ncbi:hybrid sensor histidine kinase/response regulator transcription factor [Hymenobacter terrenus]|uniref:hybrid sensor histidine kinase/response regulator transcription factor n=1 Tax=Hymenobacter terrenus TaxID=1629124 RepID=UPI00061960AE|nr:substrate-binding domain-containing protein [Hymenobacter terrenus]
MVLSVGLVVSCAPQEPKRPAYRIVFAQCNVGGNWRDAVVEGMRRELTFHPEVQFRTLNAESNIERQQAQLRALAPGEIDLLIVSPCETKRITLTAALEETYERGVPVIVLEQRVNSRRYTAYVGSSNVEVGRAAARYAASLPRQQGHIIEIMGLPGTSPATQRHQGFTEALATFPGLRVVGQLSSKWAGLSDKPGLVALLQAHPEVDLIFAHSDVLALAAYRVCQELGRAGKVRIIGVDGLPGRQGGIELVQDGVLAASILHAPGGEEAIRLAMRVLTGQSYERENRLGVTVIDSTNVLMMRQQTDRLASQQRDIERQRALMEALQNTYASQHTLLYGLLGALVAVAGFGIVAWRANRQQRHLNGQLALRNEENDRINTQLTARNEEISRINAQLTAQNEEISRQRNQLEALAEQSRADTEAKLRFFTNFSHELRTPLTLILGPVEELLTRKASLTAAQRHDLGLVRRNTQRLLQLVNQLMDFRKMEVGKMPVQASEGNLVTFMREIVDVFEQPARLRGIDLRWLPAVPALKAWFDTNILDKVLFNLLSNALKFTPEKGQITVRLQPGDADCRTVRISVEDTGRGISDADRAHIFEWFYQGGASGAAVPGSGIGLALALGLARLHLGELTVHSQPGQGSTFELTLPTELPTELRSSPIPAPEADELVFTRPRLLAPPSGTDEDADGTALTPETTTSETLVLVIEDNPEVNNFLVRKLQPDFQVQAATDGTSGLQMAIELIPDLIVCDVMMPGLSGLEVVAQLREDWRTSHIPVVLLTARNAPEQQVEGVQAGADLYLTKPFNPTFLLESVRTLLANRARQREHFRRELSLDTATVAPTRGDQQFLADLTAIIEANLSRTELSVDDVGRSMNLSRMQLYRKVKAVLGTGLTEHIQSIRLTKARLLLLDDALTIAEVGYELGFSSPSYFSTSFKSKYQMSPSEFRALHTTPEG